MLWLSLLLRALQPIVLLHGVAVIITSLDVHNRARTIEKELNAAGIQMITYSADGDSRELKMMREHIRFGLEAPKNKRKYLNISK